MALRIFLPIAFLGGSRAITEQERQLCHTGVRNSAGRMCHAYTSPKPQERVAGEPVEDHYPSLAPECANSTWWEASAANNWGSCVNISFGVDASDGETYRYITTNSVPPYYFNPYCPFGLYSTACAGTNDTTCGGYCIKDEPCPFPELKCGVSTSSGFTEYGDVWVAKVHYTKVPVRGNPTRAEVPADMYQAVGQGAHTCMATTAVHINGNSIQGPNDAGAVSVDVAGFQLMCGGHVTPPVTQGILAGEPMYHYHKAADCTPEFTAHSKPIDHNGTANRHGLLFAYALDGFGIYGYEDLRGEAPVLDQCGGHFGPVQDGAVEVEYHYHATTYTPYHVACQGPSLNRCEETQHGASFCGEGCGYEVCVQPGTDPEALRAYVGIWNTTWLESYSNNLFPGLTVV